MRKLNHKGNAIKSGLTSAVAALLWIYSTFAAATQTPWPEGFFSWPSPRPSPHQLPPRQSLLRLQSFSYADVRVTGGPLAAQADNAHEIYFNLNEDSLLQGFRLRAGLPAPGRPMGGWYDPDGFAGGHSFGQYLSALARIYANSRDEQYRAKVARLIHGFHETLGPDGYFYSSAKVAKNWPCYVYDKNATGMRDAYTLTGNREALIVLSKMTDWADKNLPRRSDEWYTLSQGLYLNYELTGEPRYLRMAAEFDNSHDFFDPLAHGINALAIPIHAYSHVNSLSSAAQTYESTGDTKYLNASINGWSFLTGTQMFATGGWGPDELFRAVGLGKLAEAVERSPRTFETPCGSYANVNLDRYLLRFTGQSQYGDNMERVIFNGMLSALPIRPDGSTYYYSNYTPGARKCYFKDHWPCCSGTYAEITADYPLDIYFHDDRALYVNLYADSSVRWRLGSGQTVFVRQKTDYPFSDRTQLSLHLTRPERFTLGVRVPSWQDKNVQISINGHRIRPGNKVQHGDNPQPGVGTDASAGVFLNLNRKWHDGDIVQLTLPRSLRFETIAPESPDRAALMYGALVLVAVADADVELEGNIKNPESWIHPVDARALTFRTPNGTIFKPLLEITRERYTTYPRIVSTSIAKSE